MNIRVVCFFASFCIFFVNAMEDFTQNSIDIQDTSTIIVKINKEEFKDVSIELLKRSVTISNMLKDQGEEIIDGILDLSHVSITPERFKDLLFVLAMQDDNIKKEAFIKCIRSFRKKALSSLLYDMEFFEIPVFSELIDLIAQQIATPEELKKYITNPKGYSTHLHALAEKQKGFIDTLLHANKLNAHLLTLCNLASYKIELPHIFPNIHTGTQFNLFCFCDNILVLLSSQHIAGWNVDDKQFNWTQNYADARSLSVAKKGTQIVTGDIRGIITLWDAQTGTIITHVAGHADTISSLYCHLSQRLLVSGSYDKTIKIWDVDTQKEVHTLKGHAGKIHCVRGSSDGKIIASCSEDKTIRLWFTNTGEQLKLLVGHTKPVKCVCFHPDDITLTSCSEDGTIRCWKSNSGKELYQFSTEGKNMEQCYYGPDGKLLIASNRSCIKVWEVAWCSILFSLVSDADSAIFFTAFTPNGDSLVALKSTESVSLVIISSALLDIYNFSELNAINTSKNFSLEQTLLLHSLEQKIITPQKIKNSDYFSAIFDKLNSVIKKQYAVGFVSTALFKLSNTFSLVTDHFKHKHNQ